MRPRTRKATLPLAALLCALNASAAPVLDDLVLARDVICSFNKSGPASAPPPQRARDDDLMVIIEGLGVDPGTANVTSSRALGAKAARVYAPDSRVHVVEDVHDSVIVTTILECDRRRNGGESGKCLRFAAVIAWHFDRAVHLNPDRTFLALPGSSYAGHCEPWNLE